MKTTAFRTSPAISRYLSAFLLSLMLAACEQAAKGDDERLSGEAIDKADSNIASVPQKHVEYEDEFLITPYKRGYYVGDLGGKPARLTHGTVMFVQYQEDDISSGTERKNRDFRIRTYSSKIRSFGFTMRYTDGHIYNMIKDNFDPVQIEKNNPYAPWVDVGITTEASIPVPENYNSFLNRSKVPWRIVKETGGKIFDLELFVTPGIDPETQQPWRKDRNADDVFVFRNENHDIETYIECSNNDVPRPPCQHLFSMTDGVRTRVSLSYSRHHLRHWKKIQAAARNAIEGFVLSSESKDNRH